jgi:hypothetical protein
MAKRIFVDLDGVMFDFDKHFEECFGSHPTKVTDSELWNYIHSHENEFFYDLPLIKGAIEGIQFIENSGFEPIFLTACPIQNYDYIAKQKIKAIRREFSEKDYLVLPMNSGKCKKNFMQNPFDILIDDFIKNINPWREAGGIGILFKDWDQTTSELIENLKRR